MQKRTLGKSNLEVSALGLGCSAMSQPGRMRRLLRQRSPGSSPRNRGSFRSRVHESRSVWTRTLQQLQSNSLPTTSVRSIQPPQRSRCKGHATTKTWIKRPLAERLEEQ